jgi:hypothetical protein
VRETASSLEMTRNQMCCPTIVVPDLVRDPSFGAEGGRQTRARVNAGGGHGRVSGFPFCATEQRSVDGSGPLRMLEGEWHFKSTLTHRHEPEFSQRPVRASGAGESEGLAQPGRLSLHTFFGEAKKVCGRGATPRTECRNELEAAFCDQPWIPAFAGMTG